jgi:mannose/cellobiose epimerase-like protein (N-acyl-D-glucosamine 2-epimerase family)
MTAAVRDFGSWLTAWASEAALPLWTGPGIDPATGTAWEALDHAGRPCRGLDRRLRVQLRQAYCFAILGETARARSLFDWVMANGFERGTGNLAARLGPRMEIKTAPHDLYDLAFAALAAAALIEAGEDIAEPLRRIEHGLARLKAPRGWVEDASRRLPRRQNPHMHLFEAATELLAATGAPRFRDMAEECLALFSEVFLQPDGRVLEFYDADWQPRQGHGQQIEPGHMAEWIYLIDRFEAVTGRSSGVDRAVLWRAVLARRDGAGFLPDVSEPLLPTRRLWPQTELLRAAWVMARHGDRDVDLQALFEAFRSAYLATPVAGGWYDRRTSDGVLVSDTMPASSFFHIVGVLRLSG